MQATKPFHSANNVPDGSILRIEASKVSGQVEAEARFLSGGSGTAERWTLAEMEAGTANATLAGPAISLARVLLAMAAGSSVQVDMSIHHNGAEIRRRTWILQPETKITTSIGLVIGVLGGKQ